MLEINTTMSREGNFSRQEPQEESSLLEPDRWSHLWSQGLHLASMHLTLWPPVHPQGT